jgi:hypothetical protein
MPDAKTSMVALAEINASSAGDSRMIRPIEGLGGGAGCACAHIVSVSQRQRESGHS